jgi:hypothetical protein
VASGPDIEPVFGQKFECIQISQIFREESSVWVGALLEKTTQECGVIW